MNRNCYNNWYWLLFVLFIVGGLLYSPAIGLLAIICMAAPVIMAIANGRLWCGRFCPRGSFYDHILARIGAPGREIPQLLKKPAARWTGLVMLLVLMGYNAYSTGGDILAAGKVLFTMVAVTTLAGILLGYFYSPRSWCAVCSVGTISMLLSKKGSRVAVQFRGNCRACGICAKHCPMDITVQTFKTAGEVTDPDCIKCGICVAACPFDALKIAKKEEMAGDSEAISLE